MMMESSLRRLPLSLPAMVRLGGAGKVFADLLAKHVEAEIRVTVLGHLQRGGSPVPFDRILATQFGEAAARLAIAGRCGRMVRLAAGRIEDVDLDEAVREIKLVDPGSPLVHTARSVGIAFGDE